MTTINIRNCADGKVTEPGLYRMTAEQYHADPCPEPAREGHPRWSVAEVHEWMRARRDDRMRGRKAA